MNNYSPQEIRLADEIAEALDDHHSHALFLQFAHRYKEEHLRDVLEKVLSVPDRKIKKTRGALYTFLVTKYSHEYTRD